MAEIMINLRVLRDIAPVIAEQEAHGVEIRRAQVSESAVIAHWVREYVNPNWGVACEVALEQTPPDCFIACHKGDSKEPCVLAAESILGFACYDVVTKGVFGPAAVRQGLLDDGLSTALMLVGLQAMAEEGYVQAIIGWAGMTESNSGET